MQPLKTEKIVEYIKTAYKRTIDKVNKEQPLHFGNNNDKVNILISFSKKSPNNSEIYSCEKFQQYYVKNLSQVIEILKELEIYREESDLDLKIAYLKVVDDIDSSCYLNVTSFKPIGFN